MRLRTPIVGIALVLLAGAGAAAAAATRAAPEVSCDRIVLRGAAGAADGFHVVLDAVSMPGARHLARETESRPGRWRSYRNGGIAIRGGTSDVTISVPEGWRDRVALSWGGSRPSSTVRFGRCAASAGAVWNSFSGGFHLRGRADCVPLHVVVGGMSTTLRVGIGRACGEH